MKYKPLLHNGQIVIVLNLDFPRSSSRIRISSVGVKGHQNLCQQDVQNMVVTASVTDLYSRW